jgi:hypothetical protein
VWVHRLMRTVPQVNSDCTIFYLSTACAQRDILRRSGSGTWGQAIPKWASVVTDVRLFENTLQKKVRQIEVLDEQQVGWVERRQERNPPFTGQSRRNGGLRCALSTVRLCRCSIHARPVDTPAVCGVDPAWGQDDRAPGNRSRPTRIIGQRFSIYAARTPGPPEAWASVNGEYNGFALSSGPSPGHQRNGLPRGVIVGSAVVAKCVAVTSRDYSGGEGAELLGKPTAPLPDGRGSLTALYEWHLTNVKRYKRPQPPKGEASAAAGVVSAVLICGGCCSVQCGVAGGDDDEVEEGGGEQAAEDDD